MRAPCSRFVAVELMIDSGVERITPASERSLPSKTPSRLSGISDRHRIRYRQRRPVRSHWIQAVQEAIVNPPSRGSRLDADHSQNGGLIPCRFTPAICNGEARPAGNPVFPLTAGTRFASGGKEIRTASPSREGVGLSGGAGSAAETKRAVRERRLSCWGPRVRIPLPPPARLYHQ
jgi:hypothetical protein